MMPGPASACSRCILGEPHGASSNPLVGTVQVTCCNVNRQPWETFPRRSLYQFRVQLVPNFHDCILLDPLLAPIGQHETTVMTEPYHSRIIMLQLHPCALKQDLLKSQVLCSSWHCQPSSLFAWRAC